MPKSTAANEDFLIANEETSFGMGTNPLARRLRRGLPWRDVERPGVGGIGPQVGLAIISQKIASTLAKAGQPSQNHARIARW